MVDYNYLFKYTHFVCNRDKFPFFLCHGFAAGTIWSNLEKILLEKKVQPGITKTVLRSQNPITEPEVFF